MVPHVLPPVVPPVVPRVLPRVFARLHPFLDSNAPLGSTARSTRLLHSFAPPGCTPPHSLRSRRVRHRGADHLLRRRARPPPALDRHWRRQRRPLRLPRRLRHGRGGVCQIQRVVLRHTVLRHLHRTVECILRYRILRVLPIPDCRVPKVLGSRAVSYARSQGRLQCCLVPRVFAPFASLHSLTTPSAPLAHHPLRSTPSFTRSQTPADNGVHSISNPR